MNVRASRITNGMQLAAAHALADAVGDRLARDHIIPSPFDERVAVNVAHAVADAARADGVARLHWDLADESPGDRDCASQIASGSIRAWLLNLKQP